ncbi:MAG: hypothetical protein E6J06_08865 [Chloroflexi bacterium]|nr:MAG: hypothetical protein E6J06_08865 [Chloroflexota bacterium]
MSIKDPPSRTISPGQEVPSGSRLAPDAASGDGKPGRAASLRRWLRDSAIRPSPIPRAHYVLGLKAAIAPFLVSRFLVWAATGFGARNLQAPPGLYSNLNPPTALAPFFHWDADAYGYIAHNGYALGSGGVAAEVVRVAWFPFYPLLVRLAGGSDWAMFLIPNISFFLALVLLYVLGVRRMDAGRAALALWLVALGPAAMFFSYPYTESVFLLSSVGAFVLMESGHWLLSGLAGMAAAATRFPGLLFAVALAAERAAGNRRWTIYAAMLLTLGGLGAVAFVQWYQMGDPLGFYHARSFWIGPERNPLYLIGSFPKALIEGDPFNAEAIGVPVLLLFAAGAAWVTGRMPIAYGVFAIAQILVAFDQGLFLHIFSLVPRVVSVIFPCYFAFATFLAPRRNFTLAWLLLSASAMVVNSIQYGGWRFIG